MEDKIMNSIGIENESMELVTTREPSGNELLMDGRRPTPQHLAKSNGDGTGYWFDNSAVIAAQEAQAEMITELNWADVEISKHNEGHSRTVATLDALYAYKNDCRDYVRNIDGVLTIVGDKPKLDVEVS